jgi:hypothetical protein
MLDDHKKICTQIVKMAKKKLGNTLELLQWKAETSLSDKGFEKLLKIMKKMLPKDNELPACHGNLETVAMGWLNEGARRW